jgi:hypothetical protein
MGRPYSVYLIELSMEGKLHVYLPASPPLTPIPPQARQIVNFCL